ncbi:hypothetical protein ACPOL_3945 [Acidisarcina polymorpha]|uniref:Uncharacterized protein n=1 Tax=Acidisarcina polymorpha TaxID=2211140 RepID=A0A2Z5G339_9BACT|nr:hypothetical protein [Acidisarcina polymorpha]AXC13224.1 hypothetical protein ACPOL_3945 [Acidisarcina polymorpha]
MPTIVNETSAASLTQLLEGFLVDHPRAVVIEGGRVLFDMAVAKYALSAEYGRCILHLWSEEKNLVRTVAAVEAKNGSLRLQVKRFGQVKPQLLQMVSDRDQRTPTTRTAARTKYLQILERVLGRCFPDYSAEGIRNAMDLEHSFGPAYARGILARGGSAWAVIGVGGDESQATIDGVLTLGTLWLAFCREQSGGRRLVEGLKVIVPYGTSEVTRARMAWMNPSLAKWELYELDERSDELTQLDPADQGNLDVRLVHSFDRQTALERAREAIDRVFSMLPQAASGHVEVWPRNAAEVAFLLHGLEFARVRRGLAANSFAPRNEITFGAGANETALTPETEELFAQLVGRLLESRHSGGNMRDPLYRLQPERWLESVLRRDLVEIEPQIVSEHIYAQVPAFAAGDRGMLDMLTVDHGGRLLVLELKADEDLHLPLQGLDYWLRVRKLQGDSMQTGGRDSLHRYGYFTGLQLADLPPLLHFVAPALRIHPSNETVLRYLSPAIEWTLIALDEHWRERRRVLFRKRSSDIL